MDTRIISIGVDVGGTNTDAVLLQGNELVAKHKTTTTSDITTGIITAIKALFESCQHLKKEVKSVNIGTTHLLNALLQRQGLAKPLVIRLAAPYSGALPPAIDWPEGLQEQLIEQTHIEDGGYEFNATEIRPLNAEKLAQLATQAAARKTFSVAITGIFSNVNPSQEEEAGQIFRDADPSMKVSLSHTLGEMGLLARENATILNACLIEQHQKVRQAFKLAMDSVGIDAQVFLTYGDGTKSNLEDNSSTPLRTLNSGPINSIKGAAVLANISDAVTVDVGGTSSDVGLLRKGEPANESSRFKIGGINCNFTSARLNSFALGGGTIISIDQHGNIHLGPESVGKDFSSKALVYGGDILTPTDIAVALGRLNIGTIKDAAILKQKISQFSQGEDIDSFIQKVDKAIHTQLAEGIKEILDSIEYIPATLVLIGGGATLFNFDLYPALIPPQITKITIPLGADVANAFGAAKSLIGGRSVQIYSYDNLTQAQKISEARVFAISQATENAKNLAIARGADPSTLKLSTMSEIHFNYLPGNYHQISLAMVGEDSGKNVFTSASQTPIFPLLKLENSKLKLEKSVKTKEVFTLESLPLQWTNLRILSGEEVDDIALGAGLLGSGGGGNPEMGRLLVRLAIKTGKEVRLVSHEDLPDSALTVACGLVGSPIVGYEKLFCIQEGVEAVWQIEKHMGKKIDALVVGEGGGTNALYPLFVAAALNIPVVDGDCMGRAFPSPHLAVPNIDNRYLHKIAAISNGQSSKTIEADGFALIGKGISEAVVQLGGSFTLAFMPMTGKEVKAWTIEGTLSTACKMGEAIRKSQGKPLNERLDSLNEVLRTTDYEKAERIFEGKIIHLRCETEGTSFGAFVVEDQLKERVEVGFQNENLLVQKRNKLNEIEILAEVPHLITIVDKNNLHPICCEDLRYGQEVIILKMLAPKEWRTESGLKLAGRDAFPLAMEKIATFLDSFKSLKNLG